MEKFWNGLAVVGAIAGICFFASFAIFVLPYLAVISAVGFGILLVVGLAATAVKALAGKSRG